MEIMIYNPAFPKDKAKAKALSKEQFDLVERFIVERMNSRKRFDDKDIIELLAKTDHPMVFAQHTCKLCKKELASVNGRWVLATSEDPSTDQYCWIDPMHGSQLHQPA